MTVLYKNIMFDVERASYVASTGGSTAPASYNQGILGHISPIPAAKYITLPAVAQESQYEIKVEVGTDVREGDRVTNITTLSDGKPWPGAILHTALEFWWVTFIRPSTPGEPLPCNHVFVSRSRAGAPQYGAT